MNRAVFLDRDGVINKAMVREGKPYPPKNLAELELTPHAKTSLAALKAQGYKLFVVTNQPDVARGTAGQDQVEAINDYLKQALPIDGFYICYHDDKDACDCRKPKAGLLLQAAKDYNIALDQSFMIGDRWRDIEAGQLAGCKTLWIDCHYQEKQPEGYDYHISSLKEAVDCILSYQEE